MSPVVVAKLIQGLRLLYMTGLRSFPFLKDSGPDAGWGVEGEASLV